MVTQKTTVGTGVVVAAGGSVLVGVRLVVGDPVSRTVHVQAAVGGRVAARVGGDGRAATARGAVRE